MTRGRVVRQRADNDAGLATRRDSWRHSVEARGRPSAKRGGTDWAGRRTEIEEEVQSFWDQFEPGIKCAGVEVLGTDEITLADIELYQRFDADWVSFEDETPTTSPMLDMAS